MENFNVGITLMVIGMAAVFVFLGIMIFAMDITAKIVGIINKHFPEVLPEEKMLRNKKQDNGAEIALAIAIAARERAGVN